MAKIKLQLSARSVGAIAIEKTVSDMMESAHPERDNMQEMSNTDSPPSTVQARANSQSSQTASRTDSTAQRTSVKWSLDEDRLIITLLTERGMQHKYIAQIFQTLSPYGITRQRDLLAIRKEASRMHLSTQADTAMLRAAKPQPLAFSDNELKRLLGQLDQADLDSVLQTMSKSPQGRAFVNEYSTPSIKIRIGRKIVEQNDDASTEDQVAALVESELQTVTFDEEQERSLRGLIEMREDIPFTDFEDRLLAWAVRWKSFSATQTAVLFTIMSQVRSECRPRSVAELFEPSSYQLLLQDELPEEVYRYLDDQCAGLESHPDIVTAAELSTVRAGDAAMNDSQAE